MLPVHTLQDELGLVLPGDTATIFKIAMDRMLAGERLRTAARICLAWQQPLSGIMCVHVLLPT
jgi:hypothetical protein